MFKLSTCFPFPHFSHFFLLFFFTDTFHLPIYFYLVCVADVLGHVVYFWVKLHLRLTIKQIYPLSEFMINCEMMEFSALYIFEVRIWEVLVDFR